MCITTLFIIVIVSELAVSLMIQLNWVVSIPEVPFERPMDETSLFFWRRAKGGTVVK